MKWNLSALLHLVTHTPSFIGAHSGYPRCQLSPNHPDLLLLLGQTVLVESLPPAVGSQCSMGYSLIYSSKMEEILLSLSVTSNRL